MIRLLVFVVCLVFFLFAGLPASLLDRLLDQISHGELRLADASGSLWHGQGRLASPDVDGVLHASFSLRWDLDRTQLMHGRLAWRFTEAGQPVLRAALGVDGLNVDGLNTDLPLRLLTQSIPDALAKAGWRGNLKLTAEHLHCGLNQRCTGRASLLWSDAGVDVLPEQQFGSYKFDLDLQQGDAHLQIATLNGAVILSGQGELPFSGRPHIDLTVTGDPKVVHALPNVLGKVASREGDEVHIRLD